MTIETNIKIIIFYFAFPIGVGINLFADINLYSHIISSIDIALHRIVHYFIPTFLLNIMWHYITDA
jgi:hypothetical protein